MKFTLTIELKHGETLGSEEEVRDLLAHAVTCLRNFGAGEDNTIRGYHGNTVGKWEVRP